MQGWILTFRTFVSDLQIRDNWLSDRKSKWYIVFHVAKKIGRAFKKHSRFL